MESGFLKIFCRVCNLPLAKQTRMEHSHHVSRTERQTTNHQPLTTMTITDILNRINSDIRTNNQADLEHLAERINDLLIEPELKFALIRLTESASELLG